MRPDMQHVPHRQLVIFVAIGKLASRYIKQNRLRYLPQIHRLIFDNVFASTFKIAVCTFVAFIYFSNPAKAETLAANLPGDVLNKANAEYLLGLQFEHGEGEVKNYLHAASLFCSAARAGNRDALFELGWMYANGRGVPSDDHFARGLFELAERLGHQHAKVLLSVLAPSMQTGVPPCIAPDTVPEPSVTKEHWQRNGRDLQNLSGEKIYRLVTRLAPRYEVDPNFALAIIYIESGFNVNAVSAKNAQGLMQLIPETAKRFHVKNPFDAEQNIAGGLAYLRWLLTFFKGDVRLVSAAYNAGEGAIQHYHGVPPYPETKRYVDKITDIYGRTSHPFKSEVQQPLSSGMKDKKY